MSVTNITKHDLIDLINSNEEFDLVDVREEGEFKQEHIRGAKLLPMSIAHLRLDTIDWTKKVIMYCHSGARSSMLANMLAQQGRDVYNLQGGIGMFTEADKDYIDL